VYTPKHTAEQITTAGEYCDRHGLLKLGGTDYHGGPEEMTQPGYYSAGQPIQGASIADMQEYKRNHS